MFEAEVEMERRSSFLPLLLMLCLVTAIVGLGVYVVMQIRQKTPLMSQEASGIATAALRGPGPAITRFRTGPVKPTAEENPGDPNYRLLEKAGLVKLAKAPKDRVQVSLTPKGESLLASIQGCKKAEEADGNVSYMVPLAQRELVNIGSINMNGVNRVVVEYNWKWVPNALGDLYDAAGPQVKSFNLWDRQTLINKYGVAFYHGDATKSTLALARNGREWQPSTE